MFSDGARSWVLATPSMFYVALFLPFAFLMGLMYYKSSHPTNLYLLGGFTLCEAYTVGVICAMYYEAGAGMIILQALILTAAVFVSLSTCAPQRFSCPGSELTNNTAHFQVRDVLTT